MLLRLANGRTHQPYAPAKVRCYPELGIVPVFDVPFVLVHAGCLDERKKVRDVHAGDGRRCSIESAGGGDRFGARFQWRVPAIKSLAPAEFFQSRKKLLTLDAPAMLPGIHDDQISHRSSYGSLALP